MADMQVNLGALVIFCGVMALLWLALEPGGALAGIAVDNVFGWGMLGLAVWFGIGRALSRLWTSKSGRAV